ncbi:hypothetical protein ACIQUQ_06875 [Streptomyces sp. NPDC101118]|uniref:hypothetical protein n=1 Tax=Streptomyces sp. NPDC101118 TaxID=3366109 RepID=UPI0037F2C620
MNVNDVVQQQIDAAERKRKADRDRRAALAAARSRGLTARHQAKLARVAKPEQYGARLAQAALRRDEAGTAAILEALDPSTGRQAALVALRALSELALTARPGNVTRTRDFLARIEASGPDAAA